MLTRTEEMLLLTVCRLQDDAFGLSIRDELEALTGRSFSVGGVYTPLDRLVSKKLLKTESAPGDEQRMGRPRRRYCITQQGMRALSEVRALQESMWTGLPEHILGKISMVRTP